ncbi:MAG TPA: S-layer homology domain-containing protein [Chloroflexia bacterium]|nr:S-layer homology domain-containing protein [Chloroflexia bacterium]
MSGTATGTPSNNRVELCHRTGSRHNPYVRIEVSERALPAHLRHGDIYPVPASGCPGPGDPTPPSTLTPEPTATMEPCSIQFSDTPAGSTFYQFVRCLACQTILGGYSDGTFRPNNDITRGQIAKIVSEATGFGVDPGTQIYEDVPPASPFYSYINRLTKKNLIGGYPCGMLPSEPCVGPNNRPYYRPNTSATRGQLSKIVSSAADFRDSPAGEFFADVPADNPFYPWIQRLSTRLIMGGYECGTRPGEPCDPQNRPYFRWTNNITRGQAAKIVSNTYFPGCDVPSQR